MYKPLKYEGIITTVSAAQKGGAQPIFDHDELRNGPHFVNAESEQWYRHFYPPYRVTVIGLGDVGQTLAVGMKLVDSDSISEIGLYDLDPIKAQRCEMELSQIHALTFSHTPVVVKTEAALYDTDVLIFTASKGVPPLDSDVKDVRLYQLTANAALVEYYVEQAIAAGFKGMLCIVSDPVDLLCKVALDKAKSLSDKLLTPVRIRGFGLGVMYARALYHANKMGLDQFAKRGRVFGPHGADLIALNDVGVGFDLALSRTLTAKAVRANLDIRELGFKPYIAPALSSGTLSIIAMLEGRWHYSTIAFDSVFFGMLNRMTTIGIELDNIPYNADIEHWIQRVIHNLEATYEAFAAKP